VASVNIREMTRVNQTAGVSYKQIALEDS
jgi:hypothetical protein